MPRWLVTQGDRQFAAKDLNELKQLAADGKVGPGDMVQPPGAADWLYASELPELKRLLAPSAASDIDDTFDDLPHRERNWGLIAALLLAVVIAGGLGMYHFAAKIRNSDLRLLGDQGLQLTEMLVTASPSAIIHKDPDANSPSVGSAPKDAKVQLIAKRGPWYQIEVEEGTRGWVKVDDVVPAYLFADEKTRREYDPIYNPDRYVFVKNASWMELPDPTRKNVTVFQFLLQNQSKFEMTDLKLLATIKDKNDKVLEKKEIAIEGSIPPFEGTMAGTLAPAKGDDAPPRLMTEALFNKLAKNDEDMQLRWSWGIEVPMDSEGFVEAKVDLLQVRAVPTKVD